MQRMKESTLASYFEVLLRISKFSLISVLIVFSCSIDSDTAKRMAEESFNEYTDNLGIDKTLMDGPYLVEKSERKYVFHWKSTVPTPGATIFEVMIYDSPGKKIRNTLKGQRPDIYYLMGTDHLPFAESMISNLFNLPVTQLTDRENDLFKLARSLTQRQLVDIANFLRISKDLVEYEFCLQCRYPASLEELNDFKNPGNCNVKPLDSLYVSDRYGNRYFYENLVNFVILGSKGENGVWDIDKEFINFIYQDQRSHMFAKDDDIIVKLKPSNYCNE